ncbi:CHAT domain-containing protein [Streptomyces iakyrus]
MCGPQAPVRPAGTLPATPGAAQGSTQLAGYRQVIGTLWPIQDAVAADIAKDVYTHLRRDGDMATARAAAALHRAVRRARAAHPREPHLWASHIHLGP